MEPFFNFAIITINNNKYIICIIIVEPVGF